ncbi:MAG: acyl-CoA carboxylase subunit epsilon [Actinomycetia bacterium]|nr:acyl-CoA carboxylase subunit epsilon [Actinomycetes bacterium]
MSRSEPAAETVGNTPLLRVVCGSPEPDELAALLAVLAARSSNGGTGATSKKRSLWAARSRQVRTSLGPGSGAWRASTLPR